MNDQTQAHLQKEIESLKLRVESLENFFNTTLYSELKRIRDAADEMLQRHRNDLRK